MTAHGLYAVMVGGERTDVPVGHPATRRLLFEQCQAMADRLGETVDVVDSRGFLTTFRPQER